jgi:ribose-phosphate pyrophosphokinase
MKLLAGNSNPLFARGVAKYLDIEVSESHFNTFSDQEISVSIVDNMRGEDVFVIQSTCYPVNNNLMELLICLDALKRSSVKRVTAVMPYYGYARQDRRSSKQSDRTAISAKLVADLLTAAGAHRVLAMDLHAGQIQGFFNIPVDNLTAMPVLADDIKRHYDKPLIISPDVGGVVRARSLATKLGTDLAIVDKRREQANVSEVMNIIGEVKGRQCIMFDDIVDTAGTLCHASDALMEAGASSVSAYVTHGVLSGEAYGRIAKSSLKEVVVTDTIPMQSESDKIRQVSVAHVFGEAIRRITNEVSVSPLNF